MTPQPRPRAAHAALLLVLGTLASCSDSDLPEHHERVLACAEAEQAGGGCYEDGSLPASEPDSGAAFQGGATVRAIDLSTYDLVFADEFQSMNLDTTKWKTALEWGPDFIIDDQLQYYVDTQSAPDFGYDPFVFDGETIAIRAQRTPDALVEAANGQLWLSGALSGAERVDVQYGYIEARVALPSGAALRPVFWMLPLDPGVQDSRLFIAEYDGGRPNSLAYDFQYVDEVGNLRSPGQFRIDEPSLPEGFHTVGVSWTPYELLFYLDGIPRYRIVGDRLPVQPMYPLLTLAIGGDGTSPPDGSTPEAPELLVDYVRIWQRR